MQTNGLTELQEIATMLDRFIEEHDNTAALERAADFIAEEIEDRSYVATLVTVTETYHVIVKHRRDAEEYSINLAAQEIAESRAPDEYDYDHDAYYDVSDAEVDI